MNFITNSILQSLTTCSSPTSTTSKIFEMEEDYRASSYDYDELFVKSLSLFSISQNHPLLLLLLLLCIVLLLFLAFLVFFYNFLEIHFLADLLTAFRGDSVSLTYNTSSQLYKSVASKCRILHGRFLPTPWLSSPHLQTAFLSLVAKSPHVTYKRLFFLSFFSLAFVFFCRP